MKKISKKFLCLVLVLMMAMPLFVFPAGAETTYKIYAEASEGDLLDTVNFSSDDIFSGTLTDGWNKMQTKTVHNDGRSVALSAKNSVDGVWGADLVNDFTIKGRTYTVVFTVTASDTNESIGFLPDDCAGFVVTPGQNECRFMSTSKGATETVVVETTKYNGTGNLTQTYAIEWGVDENWNVTAYDLYVVSGDKWISAYKISSDDLKELTVCDSTGSGGLLDWGEGYEDDFTFRFYHNRKNENQNGTVTVSDAKIYKGFAATLGTAAAPETIHKDYDTAAFGDLIYEPNFNGDGVLRDPKKQWAGIHTDFKVSADGKNVKMKGAWNESTAGAWGADLQGYTIRGKSYTVIFTVEPGDDNEEIGFFPDDCAGFVVNPGQNKYKFVTTIDESGTLTNGATERIIASGEYKGNGAAAQTYAIAWSVNEDWKVTAYNLYVDDGEKWISACKLSSSDLTVKETENSVGILDWGYEDDFTWRFYHNRDDVVNNSYITISDVKVYKGASVIENEIMTPRLKKGAAVRMDDPTGLRFTGFVGKDYFDGLETQYGAENVEIGMLITPTDYLTANNLEFTKNALDTCEAITGVKYLEIDATTILTDGNYYKVNCVIANIKEANYDRAFSAILYIKVNDEIIEYSEYDAKNNSRSVAEVAELAYGDLADAEGTVKNGLTYSNPVVVGDVTKYSPYTEDQRKILEGFFQ